METPEISKKMLQEYIADVYVGASSATLAERETFLKNIPQYVFEALVLIKRGRNYDSTYAFGFTDALWLIAKTQEEKQISDLEKLAKL